VKWVLNNIYTGSQANLTPCVYTLTFREIVQKLEYNIEIYIEFFNDGINLKLNFFEFFKTLFEINEVVGILCCGKDEGHYLAFQLKLSILKLII
jgi:hypothetical protein